MIYAPERLYTLTTVSFVGSYVLFVFVVPRPHFAFGVLLLPRFADIIAMVTVMKMRMMMRMIQKLFWLSSNK